MSKIYPYPEGMTTKYLEDTMNAIFMSEEELKQAFPEWPRFEFREGDEYQFQDGPYLRNMTAEAYADYCRILAEAKSKEPVSFKIRRSELLPTNDEAVRVEDIIYLKGKRFYDAIFINGVTDQALEIAIESAKHFLKIE